MIEIAFYEQGSNLLGMFIPMDTFSYDNIWLPISLWGSLGTTAIFILIVMGGKGDKTSVWRAAWIVFTVSIAFMTVAGFIATDRGAKTDIYQQQVKDHIKTTGDFDSVEGKLEFTSEKPSTFKVKAGEAEGDCFAMWPEEGTTLEFGCGAAFAPLEEGKAAILQAHEAEKAEEAKKSAETEKAETK